MRTLESTNRLPSCNLYLFTKMPQHFSWKRQFILETRNGILWDSVSPTGCNVMMRWPRAEAPFSLHLPIQEARRELGHLHFMFWVELTYRVQTGCKYKSKAKEKEQEKNRTKNPPTPICNFFLLTFTVIRTYWKIIQDYPSHL